MSVAIEVQGIVSARTQEPCVQIRFSDGSSSGQFTVDEARTHAALVLEAAANATYEAAFFLFLREEMGLEEPEAAKMLGVMRIWRADKWGQPNFPEDWRSE